MYSHVVGFANNVSTTLTATLSTSGTDLYVSSTTGFPTVGGSGGVFTYYATLIRASDGAVEVIKCGSLLAPDRISITRRGADGTTALAFAIGDRVELRLTRGALYDIQAGQLTGVQYFTDQGVHTYTPNPATKWIYVEAHGAGGGGGSCGATTTDASVGDGGEAGSYARFRLLGSEVNAFVGLRITIGDGGNGGTVGGGGDAGGDTVIEDFAAGSFAVSLPGGHGGLGDGAGSAGPRFNMLWPGLTSFPVVSLGAVRDLISGPTQKVLPATCLSTTQFHSGMGGNSVYAKGGYPRNNDDPGAGINGSYGSGGGGAAQGPGVGTAKNGGKGGAGVVIIYEYSDWDGV